MSSKTGNYLAFLAAKLMQFPHLPALSWYLQPYQRKLAPYFPLISLASGHLPGFLFQWSYQTLSSEDGCLTVADSEAKSLNNYQAFKK